MDLLQALQKVVDQHYIIELELIDDPLLKTKIIVNKPIPSGQGYDYEPASAFYANPLSALKTELGKLLNCPILTQGCEKEICWIVKYRRVIIHKTWHQYLIYTSCGHVARDSFPEALHILSKPRG